MLDRPASPQRTPRYSSTPRTWARAASRQRLARRHHLQPRRRPPASTTPHGLRDAQESLPRFPTRTIRRRSERDPNASRSNGHQRPSSGSGCTSSWLRTTAGLSAARTASFTERLLQLGVAECRCLRKRPPDSTGGPHGDAIERFQQISRIYELKLAPLNPLLPGGAKHLCSYRLRSLYRFFADASCVWATVKTWIARWNCGPTIASLNVFRSWWSPSC